MSEVLKAVDAHTSPVSGRSSFGSSANRSIPSGRLTGADRTTERNTHIPAWVSYRPVTGSSTGETRLVVGLVSGAHFVNHMYIVLLPPIFGVLTGEFGVGLAALGIAMGAQGLMNTTLQLPYGYFSDRRSRVAVLAVVMSFGALGALITALAPSYAWLVVGQIVVGLGVAGHHATNFPLLAAAAPTEYRGRAFSVHGFAGSLGFAATPAIITGALAFGLTWRHAVGLIGVVGAVYGLGAVALLSRYASEGVKRAPEADTDDRSDRRSIVERVRAEFASIAASPPILALALFALVVSTANWGVSSYVVVLLTDGYGVGLETANLTLTGVFVVSAVMILVGGELTDRFSPGPLIVGSYAVVAVLVAVFGSLAVPTTVALVCVLLIGVRTVSGPARSKLADRFSGRADLGRNFAVITVGTMIGNGLAPPVFGALIDAAGFRVAFGAIAGLAVVATVVAVGIVRGYADGLSIGGVEQTSD